MPSQPLTEYSATETYSKNILGPAFFEMSGLVIAGTAGIPAPPFSVAPSQSPYIVANNEKFAVSLTVKFNKSPLTSLLMCLGTEVHVRFAFEGIGGKATEKDVEVIICTKKDTYEYEVKWEGTPEEAELTAGLYGVAAVAQVGPVKHECSQPIIGYGYLAGKLLQVYPA
ncbi:hypothetical protein N836_23270 [Leptolyngbya sp. Heron Island J]|uniref:hypothetical protein n=1 Tax=Leptolyngbya sp. Heron Island J TaxID=1385935 RepID=UPI0003B93A67|nr:hypothetical protein [Leptolyngbya sp. Heron Island J]ESA32987.1 hypothetical protein N836_23270 [Leptolyngbya sp. Heron Island J]